MTVRSSLHGAHKGPRSVMAKSTSGAADLPLVLALLRDRGPLSLSELSEYPGVSRSTIDRDVAELGRIGLLGERGHAVSELGGKAGVIGAAYLARKTFLATAT